MFSLLVSLPRSVEAACPRAKGVSHAPGTIFVAAGTLLWQSSSKSLRPNWPCSMCQRVDAGQAVDWLTYRQLRTSPGKWATDAPVRKPRPQQYAVVVGKLDLVYASISALTKGWRGTYRDHVMCKPARIVSETSGLPMSATGTSSIAWVTHGHRREKNTPPIGIFVDCEVAADVLQVISIAECHCSNPSKL